MVVVITGASKGIGKALAAEYVRRDYENFMTAESVAEKIIDNVASPTYEAEQIIRRPNQLDGPRG